MDSVIVVQSRSRKRISAISYTLRKKTRKLHGMYSREQGGVPGCGRLLPGTIVNSRREDLYSPVGHRIQWFGRTDYFGNG